MSFESAAMQKPTSNKILSLKRMQSEVEEEKWINMETHG